MWTKLLFDIFYIKLNLKTFVSALDTDFVQNKIETYDVVKWKLKTLYLCNIYCGFSTYVSLL